MYLLTSTSFDFFNPLYTTIAVFSLLFLIALVKFDVPAKIVLFIGAFTLLISAQLFATGGILIDELNAEANSRDLIFVIIIALLNSAAIIFAFVKQAKQKKRMNSN